MAVKIRLSRIGKKHVPFYRIVATDSRNKRDGAFLEDLGTYDTLKSSMVTIKPERIEYWLSVGAVPTDSFKKVHKTYKRSLKVADQQAPVAPKSDKKKAAKQASASKSS